MGMSASDLYLSQHPPESMGACLVANDLGFSQLGKEIFDRRVKGQSWKQIGDEMDLGSPGKARSLFTKHTGITDYKITGKDLEALTKGGIHPDLLKPKIKALKGNKVVSDTTKIPAKLNKPGEQTVIDLFKSGTQQYTKLAAESGLSMAEVDQIVWRELLEQTNGDVWKAHQLKKTSEEGIKAVRVKVFEMRSNGYTVAQVADHLGMPEDVVKQILGGKYNPSPFTQPLPKHPDYKPPVGQGPRPPTKFGSGDFPLLTDEEMMSLYTGGLNSSERSAISYYTGAGSGPINNGLRGTYGSLTSSETARVANLDSAMKTVTQPMTVTRGMNLDGFNLGKIGSGTAESVEEALVGVTFADPGYLSTSIHPSGVFHQSVRLEIEVPPGAQGIYVQDISHHKSEFEFLMARNTNILITSVEQLPNNTWLVKGRVVVSG